MYMNGWNMGGMWFIGLAAILFLVVASVVLAKLLPSPQHQVTSPESTLRQRYARGEISRDDYEQMLADIRR